MTAKVFFEKNIRNIHRLHKYIYGYKDSYVDAGMYKIAMIILLLKIRKESPNDYKACVNQYKEEATKRILDTYDFIRFGNVGGLR